MGQWIVDHELYGKVLLDTKTQTYKHLEQNSKQIFNYNGKTCTFYDSINEFIESDSDIAVIPFVCLGTKAIKKRTMSTLLDINNALSDFYNVERINDRWIKNEISKLIKNRCYFCILSKNNLALNDCILLSTLEITEGMSQQHSL